MKVVSVDITNFKGISGNISAEIDGKSLLIFGKNSKGKTSFIDAIYSVLDSSSISSKPINVEADSANVSIILEKEDGQKIKATRKYTSSGNTLKIETNEFEISRPAAYLKKIIGSNIDYDPIQFAQYSKSAKGRKIQAEIVQEILQLDFAKFDSDIEKLKELKLSSYRKIEELKGNIKTYAEQLPTSPSDYEVPVSVSELVKEKEALQVVSNNASKAMFKMESLDKSISEKELRIAEKKKEIEALEAEIISDKEAKEKCVAYIEGNKDAIAKVESIDEKIATAATHNQNYNLVTNYNDVVAKLEEEEKTHKNLILNIKDARAKKLSSIEKKCDELDLGKKIYITEDGYLYVDQIPIEELNTAQQIEVGLLLYMNTNPVLKIVRLEISTLDEDTRKEIESIIKKYDFQAFMEKVDNQDDDLHINIIES